MMVGRIEGTLDGRPWSCTAHDNRIDLHFTSLKGLRKSHSAMRSLHTTLFTIPSFAQIPITLKAGPLPRITLQPNPGILARLLRVR